MAARQPRDLVAGGRPVWLSTIVVSGKSRASRAASLELAPRRLQLEVQAERREARIAPAPLRIVHLPGFGLWRTPRTKQRPRLRLQDRAQSSRSSQACAMATVGNLVSCAHLGNEIHLAHRIARIPFRLYIDAARHVPAGRVARDSRRPR